MRIPTFAVVVAAALLGLTTASTMHAQEGAPPPPPPPPTGEPGVPPLPPNPAAIPVPDGPVVENGRKELEGGLITEDIKVGEGFEVKPGGAVVALYHGTLKDGGKIFDSAFERGEPIAFPLAGVIPGWQQGVPGMKVGGVRRLIIPSALAYGDRGAGGDIPPGADLIFIIQLVDAIQTEDIKVGTGDEAVSGQCVAVTHYTITDKDGKEIEKRDASNTDGPYIWLPGEFQGIQFGLEGMKVGGKRKIIVPKEMNVSPPQVETTRPQNVPLTIEVELIALRNLQQQQQRR